MRAKKPYKRLKLGSRRYLGYHTLIDAEDYERISKYKWYVRREPGTKHGGYRYVAEGNVDGRTTFLARFIMKARKGQIVDHINRNPLDNRKANLRFVTRSQNRHNTKFVGNQAGHRGIYWDKYKKYFKAEISIDKKIYVIGCFKKKRDAIKAYRAFVTKKLKEFAVF